MCQRLSRWSTKRCHKYSEASSAESGRSALLPNVPYIRPSRKTMKGRDGPIPVNKIYVCLKCQHDFNVPILLFVVFVIMALKRPAPKNEPADYGRVKDKVLRLRERVRTLERIVTDPDEGLSRDFRKL